MYLKYYKTNQEDGCILMIDEHILKHQKIFSNINPITFEFSKAQANKTYQ